MGNGQWSGWLALKVGEKGAVQGRYRSDQTGESYPVTGQIQADRPGHLLFEIQLPRARQEYDARLWTAGKAAMSGTVNLLDGVYGFVAIREGERIFPVGAEIPTTAPEVERPTLVLELKDGALSVDGKETTAEALPARLKEAMAEEERTVVSLRASGGDLLTRMCGESSTSPRRPAWRVFAWNVFRRTGPGSGVRRLVAALARTRTVRALSRGPARTRAATSRRTPEYVARHRSSFGGGILGLRGGRLSNGHPLGPRLESSEQAEEIDQLVVPGSILANDQPGLSRNDLQGTNTTMKGAPSRRLVVPGAGGRPKGGRAS